MSDIAIRFDGLLFGLLIAVSGLLLALVALILAARAYWGGGDTARPARIARACALGVLACFISFGMLFAYIETAGTPATGPDWLDWAALPWAAILLGGLARLSRSPAL